MTRSGFLCTNFVVGKNDQEFLASEKTLWLGAEYPKGLLTGSSICSAVNKRYTILLQWNALEPVKA